MYTQYYLEARDTADKIQEGRYEGPVKTDTEGFIPRMDESNKEPSQGLTTEQLVMHYMQNVRKNMQLPETNQGQLLEGDTATALEALGQIESGGNYRAMGPVVEKGTFKGQRAVGKYQVMEGNVPVWTKQVLGKSLTVSEFLADEKAQDIVAATKMEESKQKYGTWDDAASVWFSGRPLKKAGNASDGYNTVPQYVNKFRKAMGVA